LLTLTLILTLGGITALLIGCQGGVALPWQPASPTPTPEATFTPTPTPTLTPTPTPLPPLGVLLAPSQADPALANPVQNFLAAEIPGAGYRYQLRPSLIASDFEQDDIRWVIVLPPYPEIRSLVAAAPQTRFLALGFDDLEPTANLSVVALPRNWFAQQAFMAGYLAAVITPDWRVGMIRLNTPEGEQAGQAFDTGALFYCASPSSPGQENFCRPTYAPIYEYPLTVYGEPGAAPEEWTPVGNYLLNMAVETIYVMPGADGDQLLRSLAQSEATLLGGVTPPEGVQNHWAASLQYDLLQTFKAYWPEFVTETAGKAVTVPLTLTHVNPDLLSPGRQQFVEKMLADLLAGAIDLGVGEAVNNP
jgi:hypothetical protein